MPRSLLVEIFGDAKQFAGELDKAAGKTRQFGKVAGVAGLAIAGGLVYGLEKSAKAAIAGQVSQAALDQSLRTTHQSLVAMKPALDDAESSGRKLGFTDDETRASLARLELATGNTKTAIADLAVAQGLARTKHIDLTTATNAMAMAMTGSQRAAKQLGIIVPAVTTNLDKLKASGVDLTTKTGHLAEAHAKLLDKMATGKAVIQATSDKVRGQAQAFADSAAGGLAQFHAQTQHLEETLGNLLLPAISNVSGALASAASFLADHTTVAKILVGVLALLATTLITVSVAGKVVTAVTKIMTATQWLLNAALDANPIALVILALVALGAAIVIAYRHSQTFRDIVTGAFNAVKDAAKAVADFVTKTIPDAFEAVLSWVKAHWPIIAVLVSGPFAPIVALATNAFGVRSALVNAFEAVLGSARSVWRSIVNAISNAMDDVRDVVKSVWKIIEKIISGAEKVIGGAVGGIVSDFNSVVSVLRAIEHAAQDAFSAASKVSSVPGKVGSVAGKVGGFLGGLIPHAAGGRVSPGVGYLVGERGPELFVSGSSGAIIPNGAFAAPSGGGGGGITLVVGPVYGAIDQTVARQWATTLKAELDRVIKL